MFSYIKQVVINTKDRIFGSFKDISNYFYIRKTINKHSKTEKWKSHNLRADWVGRIYTVVNLREEDFGEKSEDVISLRFMERAMPVFEYLNNLNLQDVVTPEKRYIEGTVSYLVVFKPLFKWLTLEWVISRIFKWGLIILIVYILNLIFDFLYLYEEMIGFLSNKNIIR